MIINFKLVFIETVIVNLHVKEVYCIHFRSLFLRHFTYLKTVAYVYDMSRMNIYSVTVEDIVFM